MSNKIFQQSYLGSKDLVTKIFIHYTPVDIKEVTTLGTNYLNY